MIDFRYKAILAYYIYINHKKDFQKTQTQIYKQEYNEGSKYKFF